MSERRIITVFGATGSQGGGLVRSILDDHQNGFAVRAVTRDPTSVKVRALAEHGAEVVAANIDDPSSISRALEGAYGAFFVTFFWDHFSPEREQNEARAYAQAAKDAGLRHAIWSTLEDTRQWVPLSDDRMPTLMGQYKVPHFDAKGESDRFFRDFGVPTTFLLTSFYWDNFIGFGMGPRRGEDGRLTLNLPIGQVRMSGIAAEDIGRCAYGIFKVGAPLIGKTVGIAGEHLSGEEMATTFTDVLGEDVTYHPIPPEVYRGLGFPGAEDLGNMFQFYRDFADDFIARRPIDHARDLNPRLQTFSQWLEAHKDQIPR